MKHSVLWRMFCVWLILVVGLSGCGDNDAPSRQEADESEYSQSSQSVSQEEESVGSEAEQSTVSASSDPFRNKVVAPTSAMLQTIRLAFHRLVNEERVSMGRQALLLSDHLTQATEIRAVECFELFEHTRPDGTGFETVLAQVAYDYRTAGENICYTSNYGDGYITEENIFVGTEEQLREVAHILFTCFKNSPSHYENMLTPEFAEHGIGLAAQTGYQKNIVYFTCCNIFATQK